MIQVPLDSNHYLLTEEKKENLYGKSFVDDMGLAAYLKCMGQHLNNSITSTFWVFDAEDEN